MRCRTQIHCGSSFFLLAPGIEEDWTPLTSDKPTHSAAAPIAADELMNYLTILLRSWPETTFEIGGGGGGGGGGGA